MSQAGPVVLSLGGGSSPEAHLSRLQQLLDDHERRLLELESQVEVGTRRAEGTDQHLKQAAGRPTAPSNASSGGGSSNADPSTDRARMRQAASAASATSGGGTSGQGDPFERMWSAAKVSQLRVFDQDLLKAIHDKSDRQMRKQGALLGSFLVGALAMPFGPIGMTAGGVFGALCGGLIGFLLDVRRRRRKIQESEIEKKRLRSLVRWATDCFREDQEVLQLIDMVVLEFKPLADIASGSKNARKSLKLLDSWISQKSVKRQLWVYMENLAQHWQNLSRAEFLQSMLVFQTLSTMYAVSVRALDEEEKQFVKRLNRLLANKSVKSVTDHAQRFPTRGNFRVMECMVYADIARDSRKTSQDGASSPLRNDDNASVQPPDEDSDMSDTEDGLSLPATPKNAGGELLKDGAITSGSVRKVLKKPFFKNWDDFMEFDCTFKHKMPITLSEFELLLQKEKESLEGWDLCVDRKEIRVAKVQSGEAGITLRAWATLPGVSLSVAFYLFHDFNQRVQWDKVFATMSLVGDSAQGSDILYSLMKVPGVTPRDFLQYRRAKMMEDGSIMMMLRSAEHPDMPENKNYIRAESYISGYILRQTMDNGQPVLNIFLMSCSDIKGLVPKWMISYMAPRKPGEWMDTLRKACKDYQQGHPDHEQQLQQYIDRYKGEVPFDFEVDDLPQTQAVSDVPSLPRVQERDEELDIEQGPAGDKPPSHTTASI